MCFRVVKVVKTFSFFVSVSHTSRQTGKSVFRACLGCVKLCLSESLKEWSVGLCALLTNDW